MQRPPRPLSRVGSTDRTRGQALVETALILPILLILLLGAIDFGRLFFGWVTLHQTARIAANFAATHPDTPTDTSDQDALVSLIESDAAALNCDPDVNADNPPGEPVAFDDVALAYTRPDGTPTTTPVLGDYATLTMACAFSPVIPLSDVLFGDPINMDATSTFPVREGCINCPAPAPVPPPPTPEQCRLEPEMEDMSVAGARLAWESAGFHAANFNVLTVGADDTSTVDSAFVDQNDPLSNCTAPQAIFSSEVDVTSFAPDAETPGVCATAPNLIGLSVGGARTAWDEGFDAALFFPDIEDDARRVVSQTTTPPSTAGVSCLELGASIDVVTGDPWPAPPPPSCKVPSMIEARRPQGEALWVKKDIPGGFLAENFIPRNGNFTIKSQSLVGGTWVPCSASITVSSGAP